MPVPKASLTPTARKPRLPAVEFIRAVCALGVITFHISCYTAPEAAKILHTYANGNFGSLFVGIFFLISGFVLQMNDSPVQNLRTFYFKRWKAIFPMFYITWLYYYLDMVIAAGTPFYNGSPWTLLLTAAGLDGYLAYRIPNYYIVGEWFLGAIVLLYILYPLYQKCVSRWGWKILLPLIPLLVWMEETDVFRIHHSCNLIYCSALFLGGMLIFRYSLHRSRILKILSPVAAAVLLTVKLSLPHYVITITLIFSMFFTLFTLGQALMKIKWTNAVFTFLGGLSFPMFLVQNKLGNKIVARFSPMEADGVIKAIVITVFFCVLYGWCIRAIANAVTKTKWFIGFESRMSHPKGAK